jgi:PhoD-like phosphatase
MATNNNHWPVDVVVPSLGVRSMVVDKIDRWTVVGQSVRVSVGSDGGKGRPWRFVFVPVIENDARTKLLMVDDDNNAISAPNLEDFNRLKKCKQKTDAIGNSDLSSLWFTFDIPIIEWPKSSYGVLVFLYQFKVQGYDKADFSKVSSGGDESAEWREAFEVLKARLLNEDIETLAPGLIQLNVTPPPAREVRPGGSMRADEVSFAVASCAYPGDLLDRSPSVVKNSTPGPADASLLRLAKRIDDAANLKRPSFLLLAGDQIYADATAGLFDPAVLDDSYRNSYQGFFGSRGARAVFNKLPVYMMLDDHEVFDNWQPEGIPDSQESRDRLQKGSEQYWKFQRNAGPKENFQGRKEALWTAIEPSQVSVFMADTRTERQHRGTVSFQNSTIMEEEQFKALEAWLLGRKTEPRPSFVLSASMVLPRPLGLKKEPASALHCDSWAGYPKSLHRLLAFLCDKEIKNAVFLSGDEHLSSFTSVEITCATTKKSACLRSIHSSALYAPYPFANAVREDFACDETFRFQDPNQPANVYKCSVQTKFPSDGDGFAAVSVTTNPDRTWKVSVHFDKSDVAKPEDEFSFDSNGPCLAALVP